MCTGRTVIKFSCGCSIAYSCFRKCLHHIQVRHTCKVIAFTCTAFRKKCQYFCTNIRRRCSNTCSHFCTKVGVTYTTVINTTIKRSTIAHTTPLCFISFISTKSRDPNFNYTHVCWMHVCFNNASNNTAFFSDTS